MSSHVPPSPTTGAAATCPTDADWRREFEEMLPRIQRHAQIVFRGRTPEAREEVVQEVVCHACTAYAPLAAQGRAEAATWSSLARYAIARLRDGRRVGTSRNVNDVSSLYCHRRKQLEMHNLFEWDDEEKEWRELVVEDSKATLAEIAAFRIDFDTWLGTLSRRNRRLALTLAQGECTSRVAKLFQVSPGRISQLRRELADAWQRFQNGVAD